MGDMTTLAGTHEEMLSRIGHMTRALHDNLRGLGKKTDVRAAFAAALDDRALFIAPWRERALKALDAKAVEGKPERAGFRRLLDTSWDGRASVGSVGYLLARSYMWALQDLLYGGADKHLKAFDERASVAVAGKSWPVAVARLLDERPQAWLPAGYKDWREVELAAVDLVIKRLTEGGKKLSSATWGERNKLTIAHPIANAVPSLKPLLAVPAEPVPGDSHMPRVSGPKFGQSERLVVSPGHEEEGLFNMPGGQSGHPLAPYFLSGHDDWVKGKPQALMPGPAKFRLTFTP